ncbi:sacsin-like [Pomacea canaliculata]|uniref:sacsin-like n=1 Tax=Pomacea canaliculata TaxID=400727 RepID=UPI000D735537|nr:sacsin-like [Pomacea canaliculata]
MEKPESSRRPPAKRESCLQREDSKRQRVSTLAEVSGGLEGKSSGFLRTSLIRELRNVLDEYPDDGQILKEMIQNAEDARAKCVKILADSRTFPSDEDTQRTEGNPYLQFFQGPALCVYNNEQFQEKDWEGIRRLHTSVKEKDPLKVGRFGLGFKSVFHLTDRLVIISGQFMMFMDPFKGANGDCTRQRLAERKSRELQYCLDKIFLSEFPRSHGADFDSDFFSGTLFWFPLRQQKSELSDTLYTEKSLKDLLQAFKTEASSMLLFLQNLERIEVHERDYTGTKPVFTVELSEKCVNAVRAERSRFKNSIRAASEQLPLAPVCSRSEVEMQLSDLHGRFQNKERWLVVNYLAGRQSASEQLLRLCRDSNLCYQPHVGVAMPLGGQHNFRVTSSVSSHCPWR